MTTVRTRTVPAMQALMSALIAAGSPVQLVGRQRKVATTTATPIEIATVATATGVQVFIAKETP